MFYADKKESIVEIGRLLFTNGFIAGTDGNLSVLAETDKILITPSGVRKGNMQQSDIVTIDRDGKELEGTGRPSSEMLMHLLIYRERPDIKACCHAHPPHATAFAVTGKELPINILPEALLTIGPIPTINYAPAGTDAVPESIKPHLGNCNAFILGNHGVFTIGRSIEEAYNRMETVEHLAKIFYIAMTIGDIKFLDEDEIARLENIRKSNFNRNY